MDVIMSCMELVIETRGWILKRKPVVLLKYLIIPLTTKYCQFFCDMSSFIYKEHFR